MAQSISHETRTLSPHGTTHNRRKESARYGVELLAVR